MNKKILIVGGTGFLGQNIATFLNKKGYQIYCLSLNKIKKKKKISGIEYFVCNLTNLNQLRKKIFFKNNFDYVFNFAGNIDHSNKKNTFDVHYRGFKNLIKVFSKLKKIKLFLQVGTSLEYGNLKSPQLEKKKCNPISNYGKAKYKAFLELKKSNIKKFIYLRLYQVYGPHQKNNRLVPYVIKSCLKSKRFNCSDGHQLRDFLYIEDLVNLIFKILKKKKKKYGVFNVGSGKPFQVKYVIKQIKKIIKKGSPIFGKKEMRRDEIPILYPDIKKICHSYNWKPSTSLNTGLKKTIKFYRHNK